MIYFTVEKEVMRAAPVCYTVASDGTQIADEWEEDWVREITTGFTVHTYDERGEHIDTNFYQVETSTNTFENDEKDVLEQIKADYPAGEYQNNDW